MYIRVYVDVNTGCVPMWSTHGLNLVVTRCENKIYRASYSLIVS